MFCRVITVLLLSIPYVALPNVSPLLLLDDVVTVMIAFMDEVTDTLVLMLPTLVKGVTEDAVTLLSGFSVPDIPFLRFLFRRRETESKL